MKIQKEQILLVGCGNMGLAYSKVLTAMHVPFITFGRGRKGADVYTKKTGIPVVTVEIGKWLKGSIHHPKKAIVAVSGDQLRVVSQALLRFGVSSLLVEKPGGLDSKEIKKIAFLAKKKNATIFIAYNRRFYASVNKAREIIKNDGGVSSFTFEFTEWSHIIENLSLPARIKKF